MCELIEFPGFDILTNQQRGNGLSDLDRPFRLHGHQLKAVLQLGDFARLVRNELRRFIEEYIRLVDRFRESRRDYFPFGSVGVV